MKDILTAHQLSLEIVTNLCYEEDGELLILQGVISIPPLQVMKGTGKIWRKKLRLEQMEMNKMEPYQWCVKLHCIQLWEYIYCYRKMTEAQCTYRGLLSCLASNKSQ